MGGSHYPTPVVGQRLYAAAALVLARRRSPRARALLAGGAVTIAVAVACSGVLLGLHWMSDVIAGLASGLAWFGIRAIAFGGRFLVLGAAVQRRPSSPTNAAWTRRVRRRRVGSAAGRAGVAAFARHREASRAGG